MASFLTSILNAITRWTRGERVEAAPVPPVIPNEVEGSPSAGDGSTSPAMTPEPEPVKPDPFRELIDQIPGIVWEVAGDRLAFISEHVTRLLGYTVDECLADADLWRSLLSPESGPRMAKDGRTIWCRSVVDASGTRGVVVETEAPPPVPEIAEHVEEPEELQAPEPVAEEPPSTTPDLRRKQVLVVHREQEALDFISNVLQQCGAKVTTVKSAAEAILALLQHHDLIITEIGVPVAEGVTLAQQLRQANGTLPAIVLRKPVDAGELTVEIAQALTR